jgi:hypothetical protein
VSSNSTEIDPEVLIVQNNGECESLTGHKRIKIWCEASPTLTFTNFLGAATHGIENLENVVSSKLHGARYELVFAPHLDDVHRMHGIAGQFILEVNSRLRTQNQAMLQRFIIPREDTGEAVPSKVGAYGSHDRERRD